MTSDYESLTDAEIIAKYSPLCKVVQLATIHTEAEKAKQLKAQAREAAKVKRAAEKLVKDAAKLARAKEKEYLATLSPSEAKAYKANKKLELKMNAEGQPKLL